MKKVFMLFLAAGAISLAACGGGKDKDGGSSAASGDAWGVCDCLKRNAELENQYENAQSEEDKAKIMEQAKSEMSAHCSAYADMNEVALQKACDEETKKAANENSGQQDPSAGNQDGNICDCLKAARSEEDAKACDQSKSIEELSSMMKDCMQANANNSMEGMDGNDGMPEGMDAKEMMNKAKDAMPEGYEMPDGYEMPE